MTAPIGPFTGRGGRDDSAFRDATIAAGLVVLVARLTTARFALKR
jgi:hypothetical protein